MQVIHRIGLKNEVKPSLRLRKGSTVLLMRNLCTERPGKGFERFPTPNKTPKKNNPEKGLIDRVPVDSSGFWNSLKGSDKDKEKDDEEDDDSDSSSTNNRNLFLIIGGVVLIVGAAIWYSREKRREITFIQFQNELLPSGSVHHLEIVNRRKVRVYLMNFGEVASPYYFTIESVRDFEDRLAEALSRFGLADDVVPIDFSSEGDVGKAVIQSLPLVATIGFLVWVARSVFGRATKMGAGGPGGIFSVGKSKAKLWDGKKSIKVRFADVAGCEEAKQEISEFVSFLKSPERYQALGAKIPKGALLVGPPGTGKTLMAKATAGEAGVPFYSVSGSDFIEVFGGVGPARVRDLFSQARKNTPCIIFLDEIDAIGRKRGAAGRNDERENTLNQLLVEMDGFSSNEGVVVLAGTNRPDILDSALMRPGRFDRQISIDLPDVKSREAIFKVHLKGIIFTGHTLEEYAKRLAGLTPGFSGADIANVVNEAALIAARFDKKSVTPEDFDSAIDRVIAGLEKKSKVLSPREKEIVAYHEAGHALVGWLLPFADPVLKVSIIPRGRSALGFSQQLPEERFLHSQEYLHNRICVLLAGRVAEFFGIVSSGAQDDLEKVTNLAYAEIVQYGMNRKFGSLSYGNNNSRGYVGKPYSDETATMVDEEVITLVEKFYQDTIQLVQENIQHLESIAKLLLEKEVIHHDDIKAFLGDPASHLAGNLSAEHASYLTGESTEKKEQEATSE